MGIFGKNPQISYHINMSRKVRLIRLITRKITVQFRRPILTLYSITMVEFHNNYYNSWNCKKLCGGSWILPDPMSAVVKLSYVRIL